MQQTTDKLYTEALGRFSALLERAKADKSILEPTAMTLATVAPDGRPTARIVLLKHFDAQGFVFYTNKQSHKGRDLAGEPRAALCFHWQPLLEQVRVEGVTESVSDRLLRLPFYNSLTEAELERVALAVRSCP